MTFNITTFKELRMYIASDLFRYLTSTTIRAFIRGWYITGFRYSFFMRCCKYFAAKGPVAKLPFLICRIALRHYSIKYGYQIPWQTQIGPGLCIGHYGPIIVNPSSVIGANCNIAVGVLLGLNIKADKTSGQVKFEYPVVGDRCYLGNGAKIIGGVRVNDDSVIGVNSVVTKDVQSGAIVVGSPAKVISTQGSAAFVGSFHPWTINL